MRLMHTSDWHLGKKLFSKERFNEQLAMADELKHIAIEEKVDLIIVSGDIFDTALPPSKAEELFFNLASELAKNAVLIVVAGNHDDSDRLVASKELARQNNIILVGDMGVPPSSAKTIALGEGFTRLKIGETTVNLVFVPFLTDAKAGWQISGQDSFSERVGAYLAKCAGEAFTDDGINIIAGHLFLKGGIKTGSERDIELGTARLIDCAHIPNCHYGAFGHIHKFMCLGSNKNIYYSGAPMRFSFDEAEQERSVNIVDFEGLSLDSVSVKRVPLKCGKRLVTIEASSISDAESQLSTFEDCLVCLLIKNSDIDDIMALKALRQRDNLAFIRVLPQENAQKTPIKDRLLLGAKEVFLDYCRYLNVPESDELTSLFLELTE